MRRFDLFFYISLELRYRVQNISNDVLYMKCEPKTHKTDIKHN